MPQKKAYIFDFDETLVTTKAKIQVYRNGVFVQSMNSKEYNTYKPKKEDKLDFSEFKDPELILNAKRFKMWPVIKNISDAVKQDKSNSTIYILTARSPIVKSYIYEFLKRNGIEIGIEHIITIGDDAGNINISNEKRKQLKKLAAQYDVITFFDDDPKNIAIAAGIAGIRTRLVESLNEGVFAALPLAQLIKLKKEYTKWFEDYKREGKLPPKRDWLRRDIKRNSSSLKELKKEYDELTTEIAKKYIQAMQTNEEMGGIGAPMATPMNVPGMGNSVPGGTGKIGSGDVWGSSKKPYVQTIFRTKRKKKSKKKQKKIVKESLLEKFTEDSDPIEDLGIGMMHQIKEWMKSIEKEFNNKDQALCVCSEHEKTEFVKYLLDAGADVHTNNDYALRSATYNGHAEIAKLLLDAGANIHADNDFALRVASEKGNTEIVKLLLDAGANVHVDNDLALQVASENGHAEVVKLLLDARANVHAKNDYALRVASEKGHAEIVKLLLDPGADVHANNDYALQWASRNGHIEVVKLLLDAKADVHAVDDYALRSATYNGHTEVVKLLLDAKADVHADDDYALRWASYFGHTEVVKLLLDAGANVHAENDYALQTASLYGYKEIVKLLLDARANVHSNDDEALQRASKKGYTEIVKLLLDAGANVHAKNDHALQLASKKGYTEIVKILKDHISKEKGIVKESLLEKFTEDSDPIEDLGIGMMHQIKEWMKSIGEDFEDKDQALCVCSEHEKTEFVKYLLNAGADVNAKNNQALRWASRNGRTEVVKLLLDAGTNVHVDNDYALRSASENGHAEIVKLLLNNGANVHANDDYALRWASRNGRTEVVKLLLDAGTNVHVDNDYALQAASLYGYKEIVKLLLDVGANVHVKNDHALQLASKKGYTEIVKILKDHISKEKRKNNKVIKEFLFKEFTKESDHILEDNLSPYDKLGMAMAKKMGVKTPFKKKKSKKNQNAMVQQKFEHSILTFDDFQNLLNENK